MNDNLWEWLELSDDLIIIFLWLKVGEDEEELWKDLIPRLKIFWGILK